MFESLTGVSSATRGVAMRFWKRQGRQGQARLPIRWYLVISAVAGALIGFVGATIWPGRFVAVWLVGLAVWIGLVLLRRLLRWSRRMLPKETSTAAVVTIDVMYILYWVGFPLLIAGVANAGSDPSTIFAYLKGTNHGQGWAILAPQIACQVSITYLLIMFPAALRRRLPWDRASKLAQTLLPAWLAAAAALMTWIFVLLLHIGGPLARTSLAATLVGGLGLAALLAPLYQFMARSSWQYGGEAVLDPVRWRAAFTAVRTEIRQAYASHQEGGAVRTAGAEDLPPDSRPEQPPPADQANTNLHGSRQTPCRHCADASERYVAAGSGHAPSGTGPDPTAPLGQTPRDHPARKYRVDFYGDASVN